MLIADRRQLIASFINLLDITLNIVDYRCMAFSMSPRDNPVPHPPHHDGGIGSATLPPGRRFPGPRPLVRSFGYVPSGAEVPTEDPYVRRYWAAVLGTAALEDLLRMAAAAHTKRPIRRPTHLHVLIQERLVFPVAPTAYLVPTEMALLDRTRVRRLAPALRGPHLQAVLVVRARSA